MIYIFCIATFDPPLAPPVEGTTFLLGRDSPIYVKDNNTNKMKAQKTKSPPWRRLRGGSLL
jgi:hypothetical protein